MKQYCDYFWKEGIPYGIHPIEELSRVDKSYKIVMDPYRKRISIEKYSHGIFLTTIYDSALLNFRHLNESEQQGWQKVSLPDSNTIKCMICDQDDRVLFIESYLFQQNFCKKCIATSPQGILLFTQEMYYLALGDKENGVMLYDSNGYPIMHKTYEVDPSTGEFTVLIKENRNMGGFNLAKN